jgi:hypothetical protein
MHNLSHPSWVNHCKWRVQIMKLLGIIFFHSCCSLLIQIILLGTLLLDTLGVFFFFLFQ